MIDQSTLQNRILSRLGIEDFSLLGNKLERVSLPQSVLIAAADQPLEFVYFLENGLASIVANSPEGHKVEAGIIGREGYAHPAVVVQAESTPADIQIQLSGDAHRIAARDLLEAVDRSRTLRRTLLRFVHANTVQTMYTALSNATHQLDERLARWLLMVHDRSDSDDLALTHEFLSLMLGVRRPSVTNALHVLEGNHFINNVRGYITIRNRPAMEEFAADAYGKPEAEYKRLLGPL